MEEVIEAKYARNHDPLACISFKRHQICLQSSKFCEIFPIGVSRTHSRVGGLLLTKSGICALEKGHRNCDSFIDIFLLLRGRFNDCSGLNSGVSATQTGTKNQNSTPR